MENSHLCRTTPAREITLAELPVGSKATVTAISPESRGRKKFADAGIIPGSELQIEAHAPFGGLIRIKIMDTSMALHRKDAELITLKEMEAVNA